MKAKYIFQLYVSNSHTQQDGDEDDISDLYWFKWYDWYYFREIDQAFPFNKQNLGQVLGPERREGN